MRGVLKSTVRVLVVTLLLVSCSQAQITPAPNPPTFFSFLGIPQGLQKIKGGLFNRRGNHPALEPKQPLKALADAANLESPVEAIKKAAEIKAAEDLKPQKIKAIKYLTKIGCGCYDKDGSITEALIAASDDCTPDVRLAVVEAIYEAANGACCSQCGATCCCNEKMALRLAEMAYLRDETGCYVEPNAEVRAAAVKALEACCPDSSPVVEITDEPEEEEYRGEGADEEVYEGEGGEGASPIQEDTAPPDPQVFLPGDYIPTAPAQPRPLPPLSTQSKATQARGDAIARPTRHQRPVVAQRQAAPSQRTWDGVLMHADPQQGIAHVHLADRELALPVGSELQAYGIVNGQQVRVGTLRVYQTFAGSVNVQAADALSRQAIVKGVAVLHDQTVQNDAQVANRTSPKPQVGSAEASRQQHELTAASRQQVRSNAVAPQTAPRTGQSIQSKTSLGGLRGLLREVSSR